MGSFYRSKHELVFVFKVGTAPHTNSFGLGDTGRYRTNVWDYAGISSIGSQRMDELTMHPTVKPTALVADAIKDCSKRGEIVLDIFGGSGTTLLASETCGRQARLLEYDPAYCDTIIARWEKLTGKHAVLAGTNARFEDVAEVMAEAERRGEPVPQPLPHPDDVIIEPGKRVRFTGPSNPEQAAEYETRCRFRDILIMQHVLDEKLLGEGASTGAMLAAWVLNNCLPQRMRLCETNILMRVLRHQSTSKRELLKLVHQAWRAVGIDKPRGWVFAPQTVVQKRL
ncbi:DNA methylase [Bosea lathyri]|uniref:site-specific DNA-methyltransferase (adenine-specific) n=2 Tax=Bosea lathyri TaxID=1036778 RepID=A0A1H6D1M6_9HYPH|nr:DNA methylase [Bosea lathyri]